MTDSAQQETAGTEMSKGVARGAQWTAGQMLGVVFTSILTSIFGGTGGLWLLAEAGLVQHSAQLTVIKKTVEDAKDQVVRVESGQRVLKNAIEKIELASRVSNEKHQELEDEMYRLFEEQRSRLTSSERNLTRLLEDNKQSAVEHTSDNAASIVRDISKKQQQVEDNLRGEINDLSRRIESVHSAFVEKLEELAEEGRVLIGGRDFPAIERWITKANYVVRSLIIPTEERLLRDMSVVKEDLRDAMIEFDRAQDDNAKLAQARRVLVIVEAVCELAVGGRIP